MKSCESCLYYTQCQDRPSNPHQADRIVRMYVPEASETLLERNRQAHEDIAEGMQSQKPNCTGYSAVKLRLFRFLEHFSDTPAERAACNDPFIGTDEYRESRQATTAEGLIEYDRRERDERGLAAVAYSHEEYGIRGIKDVLAVGTLAVTVGWVGYYLLTSTVNVNT